MGDQKINLTELGLSTEQANEKLSEYGYNELKNSSTHTILEQVKKIFLDPMGLMLLCLSGLYWSLGDRLDSIVLLIAFIPVTAVDVILEIQSNKALEALKKNLTKFVKVIRDHKIVDLEIRNLVPDDVIVFEEGQTLPVDGILLKAEHLSINEAALTGESVPVTKSAQELFFGGTTVISGSALGLVQKTGPQSKYGEIAKLVEETSESKSPLRKTVDRLVKIIVVMAVVFASVLFVIEFVRTGQWVQSLIVALTLGMAAVPEEFPLVFTLYLSLGAWRLSKRGVLIKSLPSVEALGGVDVICTDKTGTLTEGLFQLENIEVINLSTTSLPEAWKYSLMACEPAAVDAMELAINAKSGDYQKEIADWELQFDYPFESLGKHMSHVWRHSKTQNQIIAMKGAVEGVLEHCQLSNLEKDRIIELTNNHSRQGRRILGLAGAEIKSVGIREQDEVKLNFLALLIFSDPVRPEVKEAIRDCQQAGIQIKMLTGDHLLTAHAVAEQIGLVHSDQFLFTGSNLTQMTTAEREQAYLKGALFARVLPEQKYEMVKVLKQAGHVVAMTGDGINDAPALRLADIGISMGLNATDVARSSAQMVLTQNNFSGIYAAVFEGRQIFANLRRSFSYLISFHIPVILLALIPPFLGWSSILLPIQIILLELIVHPISAFSFESIKDQNLKKNQQRTLLTTSQLIQSLVSGLLLSLFALLGFALLKENSEPMARAFAFTVVILGNIFLVFFDMYPSLNKRFYITSALLFACALLLAFNTWLQSYFHFASLSWGYILMALGLGFFASVFRFQGIFNRLIQKK